MRRGALASPRYDLISDLKGHLVVLGVSTVSRLSHFCSCIVGGDSSLVSAQRVATGSVMQRVSVMQRGSDAAWECDAA
jgi:hypothetical protein